MSSPGIEPSGIEAKSQLLKQRIEKRMQECEVLLADLEKVKSPPPFRTRTETHRTGYRSIR